MKSHLLYFFLLFVYSTAFTQKTNISIQQGIDSLVRIEMEKNNIAGLSLGIVKNGSVYYTKGYGTINIKTGQPVNELSRFHLASISKLFTATAVMQMTENGKIDIYKKLTDYIPEFSMAGIAWKNITIEQLLTHTSGIGNYTAKFKGPDSIAIREYMLSLHNKKMAFAPGVQLTSNTYSNSGYIILGYLIEKISGQQFGDYVKEHILLPSGMMHSGYHAEKVASDELSQPHLRNKLNQVHTAKHYPGAAWEKPNANLISCSQDLCLFMLQNLKIYADTDNIYKGIISHHTLTEMWTTTHEISGKKTSMGLGWWIVNEGKKNKYVFHVGNNTGFSTILIIWPALNTGIVILCNGRYAMETIWNKMPFDILKLEEENL